MREERIGDCRLILGDCMDALPGLCRVDALATDPPYGIDLLTRGGAYRNDRSHRQPARYASHDDSAESWPELVLPRLDAALALADAGAVFCACSRVTDMPPGFLGGFFTPAGTGLSPWGFNCLLPVMFYGRCPYLARGMGSRPTGRYGVYGNDSNEVDHPCAKPLRVMEWVVERVSLAGQSVLDPFMGSGTTGVACVKLGRSFTGIEIEERYFDLACARIEAAYRQADLFIPRPPQPQQNALPLEAA